VNEASSLRVEVACALPDKQRILPVEVFPGATAREAVELSGIQEVFPELDVATCQLGVFGEVVADTYSVQLGDRVEVYRPLINEPRESRRARAARGATIGKPDQRQD
jgi:putative ubiquitin-RnfH superfamily antitoxin RatB of RatAB toxin-antitoxin module